MRCAKWLGLASVMLSLLWATNSQAGAFDPQLSGLSLEFWAGILFAILLAMVTGYARGIEKRVALIEYDNRNLQSQISGLREMVKGEYHPKAEVAAHLDEIKSSLNGLHRRMDYIQAGQSGRPFPDG